LETGELYPHFLALKVKIMNILGRVLGGILTFIALAWLATIAQVLPFMRSNNQLVGQTPVPTPTQTGAAGAPSGAAANQRTAAAPMTAPRSGVNTVIAQTSPAATTSPATTVPATTTPVEPPVPAGW
jgi:hypothetical protein